MFYKIVLNQCFAWNYAPTPIRPEGKEYLGLLKDVDLGWSAGALKGTFWERSDHTLQHSAIVTSDDI
jgi:hypothetical protein